jgi:hypothetical protein
LKKELIFRDKGRTSQEQRVRNYEPADYEVAYKKLAGMSSA